MKFTLFALIPLITAVPFKRFDNATTADFEPYNSTSTITVIDYTTIELPSTTLVVPTTATSQLSILSDWMQDEGISTITNYVTSYETLTSDGSIVTQPVTYSSNAVVAKTDNHETETADVDTNTACNKETVTVTATETESVTVTETIGGITSEPEESTTYSTIYLTSTLTTSYPVTAELTYSDLTTTLTTYVEITSTSTIESITTLPIATSFSSSVFPTMSLNSTVGYNATSY